jgi:hypothetical protein
LRGGRGSRPARSRASWSIAVTPGSVASPVPVEARVALHDGQVSSSTEGSTAEHHGQWNAAGTAPVVSSSAMAGMLTRVSPVGIPQPGYWSLPLDGRWRL